MRSKLNKAERKDVVSMRGRGMTQQAIADDKNVSQPTISRVLKEEGYKQEIEAQKMALADTKMELADTKLELANATLANAKLVLAYAIQQTQQNMLPIRR